MGISSYSALVSSPLWMASTMARVWRSLKRYPTPYGPPVQPARARRAARGVTAGKVHGKAASSRGLHAAAGGCLHLCAPRDRASPAHRC